MAKLLVPAGASCQASWGEMFLPGQGQMAGLRGLQARFWSSPPKRTGMRAPSLMEVEVRVIHGAAQAVEATIRQAARPSVTLLNPPMTVPLLVVGSEFSRPAKGFKGPILPGFPVLAA